MNIREGPIFRLRRSYDSQTRLYRIKSEVFLRLTTMVNGQMPTSRPKFREKGNRMRLNSLCTAASMVILAALSYSQSNVAITVDANLNRHAISPLIYGVNYGTAANMLDLNVTINREGGPGSSRYNWLLNGDNRGSDRFFESIFNPSAVAGERIDTMIDAGLDGSAAMR